VAGAAKKWLVTKATEAIHWIDPAPNRGQETSFQNQNLKVQHRPQSYLRAGLLKSLYSL
jgi:hypothetical protein